MNIDLTKLPRSIKRSIVLSVDISLIPLALYGAFALRYGVIYPFQSQSQLFSLWLLPAMMVLGLLPIHYLRLSSIKLNAIEAHSMMRIGLCALTLTAFAIITSYLLGLHAPRSVPLIFGALFLFGALSARLIGLVLIDFLRRFSGESIPVAIYGAGAAGIQLAASIRQNADMHPVIFVDDNVALQGLIVAGLKVKPARKLDKMAKSGRISKVLVAMPSVSRARRLEVVKSLADLPCEVQMTPSFMDLLSGNSQFGELKTVKPDELLGRDKVNLDIPDIAKTYAGRVIMVTGAGGSIGSELCRQLIECRPAKIVLFELNEYALYTIDRSLRAVAAPTTIEVVARLGSVCNRSRIDRIILEDKVDIILHAAAYKHVPLLEDNAQEGMRNNAIGTQTVAQAANDAGIDRFILVSSDKAVRPTSVMGATKRMAELIVQDLQSRSDQTKFAMVRFGNVLGSSGSVLPLFREQIAAGGPVTVTHEEVTRYFMTIPEAARLILLAGAYSEGGDVFLLDMGEPIKIMDLAKRMIELSGRKVAGEVDGLLDEDGDVVDAIAVEVVGLRPGEKLYEEMLINDDSMTKTPHEKIVRANEQFLSQLEVAKVMKEATTSLAKGDTKAVLNVLDRWIVPEEVAPVISSEQV